VFAERCGDGAAQLEQMDLELRNIPAAARAKLQQRYKSYKSDYLQLEKDFVRHLPMLIVLAGL